jgi:two-component system phosphate regulon sensor histidine kinase PhoR
MNIRLVFWQVFIVFTLLFILALTAVTWFTTQSIKKLYTEDTSEVLRNRALLIREQVTANIREGRLDSLRSQVDRSGALTKTRITIILSDGQVIADSEKDPELLDNHGQRPEVLQALSGQVGISMRYSYSVESNMIYVALPLMDKNKILALVRTAIPIDRIDNAILAIQYRFILAGILTAIIIGLISGIILRSFSHPLEELTTSVKKIAAGDFSSRLSGRSNSEMNQLAEAFNEMAAQLDEKIRTIDRQNNEQQAVLQSMAEGVLAVDKNECLISINRAAAQLLGLNGQEIHGKHILEVIRNSQLQRIISESLKTDQLIEDEITLRSDISRYMHVHGANLQDQKGESIGALIVLNDVTRLRRLEEVRRDFVANVSHEIRTPLTSIKGFVETLRDGAINEPEVANKFLEIIAAQTNRLNAIIEDLLILASLEQDESRSEIQFDQTPILAVINDALSVCRPAAQEKEMSFSVQCPENMVCRMNGTLIEQAMINLMTNAVKYSPPNTRIQLICKADSKFIVIEVKDQGMGISRENQQRIFERFYRVDKARSREVGGTGLGLAIVKHIARVHGGNVWVESQLGSGSSFFLSIPV